MAATQVVAAASYTFRWLGINTNATWAGSARALQDDHGAAEWHRRDGEWGSIPVGRREKAGRPAVLRGCVQYP